MERILTRWSDIPDIQRLEVYEANGGYQALRKALFDMKPEEVINEVKNSNLRGRGGAAFPTGTKWSFIPKDSKKPVYVCCNADESEPGTFANRYQLELDPHQVLEGVLIACRAVNSHVAYIYFRGEFTVQKKIVETAIAEARAKGYLGRNVMGSGFDVEVYTHRGAGAYICGEETGLLESLEGSAAIPATVLPFPPSRAHSGRPPWSTTSRRFPTCRGSSKRVRTGIDRSVPRRARGRSSSASRATSTNPDSMSCRWDF